jgi:hypothetical protein
MSGLDELARGLAQPVATPWLRPVAVLASGYLVAMAIAWLVAGGWAAPCVGAAMSLIIDRRVA